MLTQCVIHECAEWNRFIYESLFIIPSLSTHTHTPISPPTPQFVEKLIDAGKLFQFAFTHRRTQVFHSVSSCIACVFFVFVWNWTTYTFYTIDSTVSSRYSSIRLHPIAKWSIILNLLHIELWMKENWKSKKKQSWKLKLESIYLQGSEKINCTMKN